MGTDETKETEQQSSSRSWVDETEEALNRTGEALRAAWEGSREARVTALEAAREAVTRLGEALDRGVAMARETWAGGRKTEEASALSTSVGEEE